MNICKKKGKKNIYNSLFTFQNTFYEFYGDWPTTCEVEGPCKDLHVTYKTGEVAVSATVFESKGDEEILVPLSSRGTSTLLYNTQGETATITYRDQVLELPHNHALIFNKGKNTEENLYNF